MGYVKLNLSKGGILSVSALNHMETQYDEFYSAYNGHNHGSRYYTEAEADARFFNSGNDGAGSGLDAETLEGHEAAEFAGVGVPSGYIIGFDEDSTPDGWVLCDGSNGTPNLQGQFIPGAGGAYSVGETGGFATRTPEATVTIAGHTLSWDEMPEHDHRYTDRYAAGTNRGTCASGWAGYPANGPSAHGPYATGNRGGDVEHGHPGSKFTGSSQENRPPFYALVYLMKT